MNIKIIKNIFIFTICLISSFSALAKGSLNAHSLATSIEHYVGFSAESDPETKVYFDFIFKLKNTMQLHFSQGFTKYYIVNNGDDEVRIDDLNVYLKQELNENISYKLGASVPLSTLSQDSGKVSEFTASLSLLKHFYNKKIKITYTPYTKFNYNKYKFDKYQNLMTKWGLGNSVSLKFNPINSFSLNAVAAVGLNYNESSEYSVNNDDNSDSGYYSFDLFSSYEIHKDISLRAGYSQGDSQVRNGVRQINLFDLYNSVFYFATDITF